MREIVAGWEMAAIVCRREAASSKWRRLPKEINICVYMAETSEP